MASCIVSVLYILLVFGCCLYVRVVENILQDKQCPQPSLGLALAISSTLKELNGWTLLQPTLDEFSIGPPGEPRVVPSHELNSGLSQ